MEVGPHPQFRDSDSTVTRRSLGRSRAIATGAIRVQFLERLADKGPKVGWRGLLVGDLSQARGGPMLTGYNSHQIGLDADIWLTPMPNRELSRREREEMSATMMVAADRKDVDPEVWTPAHTEIIKAAAKDPIVERIFVNAAIKKALCREAGNDRSWLRKVRPYYGTTTISTSASSARPTAPIVGRKIRCRQVKSAAMISITGSTCIPGPRRSRRRRSPR